MKKLFEIPQLKVVHFEEGDIIITSDCGEWWYCGSYNYNGFNGEGMGAGSNPYPSGCNSAYEEYSSGYGACSSFSGEIFL